MARPVSRARSVAPLGVPLVLASVIAACRGGSAPSVATEPVASGPESVSSATSSRPPEQAASAPPSASAPTMAESAGRSDASEPVSKACLMVNVCSCNLGCASIRVPSAQLREGTRTRVVKGALAGQQVKIVEVVDAAGKRVLALTDLDHDHACSLPVERALVGYGCAADKIGPVPANACAKGCN